MRICSRGSCDIRCVFSPFFQHIKQGLKLNRHHHCATTKLKKIEGMRENPVKGVLLYYVLFKAKAVKQSFSLKLIKVVVEGDESTDYRISSKTHTHHCTAAAATATGIVFPMKEIHNSPLILSFDNLKCYKKSRISKTKIIQRLVRHVF